MSTNYPPPGPPPAGGPMYPPPGQPGGQAMYPPPGQPGGPPMYPPPVKKKVSPIVWVLIGLGAFFLVIVILVVGAGFFFVHKARQAGLDPALMRRNPALASVKIMAALNPNIEVLSVDEGRGLVTVRDKKEGKTYSVNIEDAKRGKFVIQQDGKDAVTFNASGDGKNGTIEVKSADGTVKIGGGQNAKIPTWVPEYPGSAPEVAYSAQSKDGDTGSYQFKTKDPADKVTSFYQDALKSNGMKISSNISGNTGGTSGGMLAAEDEDKKHSAVIMIGAEGGETTVAVTFTVKK